MTTQETVFTNDNCTGCNRCIAACHVPGANRVQMRDGKNRVVVDNTKCIHCGHCIGVCQYNAREYIDDTDLFFADLRRGKPIALAVDPSFFIDYPEIAPKVLGYLRSLGVTKIYDTSIGADIASWAYVSYFKAHPNTGGILQPCSAVVNFLEMQAPHALSKLLPVHSPLMCLAVYARKYSGETHDIAFLNACIAKKDEIESEQTHGLVQYNVTYKHLFAALTGVNLDSYSASFDAESKGRGSLYAFAGGIRMNLEPYLSSTYTILSYDKGSRLIEHMPSFGALFRDKQTPLVVEPRLCEHGCVCGGGVDPKTCDISSIIERVAEIRAERPVLDLDSEFSHLDVNDFTREYKARPVLDEKPISDEEYEKTFATMYKFAPETRKLDCRACGYNSCKQMAEAIIRGYNVAQNCVHFERDENYRLYTANQLTGLPNSFVFWRDLESRIEKKQTAGYTLIHLNIMNFVLMNRLFGHVEGDAILVEFAHEMQNLVGKDVTVYHISGINFRLVLSREKVNKFLFDMEHLEIPRLVKKNAEIRSLKIRCGAYSMDGNEEDVETIDSRVSIAYMNAKMNKSGGTVFYDQIVATDVIQSLKFSQVLRSAFEKREFFVVYQPKVRLNDRRLAGAEALIRWRYNGELVYPGKFIEACETTGLIRRMDFYVLNEVCRAIASWIERGIEVVKISVNFSKIHFSQGDVADRICNIIDSWNVPHEYIEIEFTETSYNDMKVNLQHTVSMLSKHNISTSIDDFGTGYSSLNLLQELDFGVLKIDRSLIDTVTQSERAKTVVANIIRMAKDLNMEIVVEGVETPDKLEICRQMNCDLIQGYIFDKPLETPAFESRLLQKQYG